MLTEKQVADFKANGFLKGGRVLTDQQVEVLRAELARVIEKNDTLERKPVRISNLSGKPDAPVWQIVLAGPVVKIDRAQLPQAPNIHWLGQQPYDRLPHLVAGWDVCLLPFALNASTRFISPSKTLEYMAAEKPVVSTAVHDVLSLYGDAVAVAPTVDDFIEACRDALTEDAEQRAQRIARMRRHVERTTWDSAVRAIRNQIEELTKRDGEEARQVRAAERPAMTAPPRPAASGPLRAGITV